MSAAVAEGGHREQDEAEMDFSVIEEYFNAMNTTAEVRAKRFIPEVSRLLTGHTHPSQTSPEYHVAKNHVTATSTD